MHVDARRICFMTSMEANCYYKRFCIWIIRNNLVREKFISYNRRWYFMELSVVFRQKLHKKLKERIKGKIFLEVIEDTLYVRIYMDDLYFETSFDNFTLRVFYGLSTDYILYEVIEKYERFLINRVRKYYFKG